jgi:hypothetical protein
MLRINKPTLVALLIVLAAFLPTDLVWSQGAVSLGNLFKDGDSYNKLESTSGEDEVYEGSPYLFKGDWLKANIYIDKNNVTEEAELRYNLHKNRLEVKYQGSVLLVEAQNVYGFSINQNGQTKFFRHGFKSDEFEIDKEDLIQVLYSGKVRFIKKFDVRLSEGMAPDMTTGKYVNKYLDTEDYYLVDQEGNYKEVPTGRWRFLRMFDGNVKSKIKKYAKQNDLSFRDEADLTKMITYYDSLL